MVSLAAAGSLWPQVQAGGGYGGSSGKRWQWHRKLCSPLRLWLRSLHLEGKAAGSGGQGLWAPGECSLPSQQGRSHPITNDTSSEFFRFIFHCLFSLL